MAEDPHSDDRGDRRIGRRRALPGAATDEDRSLDDILASIRRLTGDAAADAAGRSRPAERRYALEDALGPGSWALPAPEIADDVAALTEAMLAAEEARRDAVDAEERRAALADRWRVQAREASRAAAQRSSEAEAPPITPPRFTPIAPVERRRAAAPPPPEAPAGADAEPLAADGGWPALERIKRRAAEALGRPAAADAPAPELDAFKPPAAAPSAPADDSSADVADAPAIDPFARLQTYLRADPLDTIAFEPDAPARPESAVARQAATAPVEAEHEDAVDAVEPPAGRARAADISLVEDGLVDEGLADEGLADDALADDLSAEERPADDLDADDLEASVFDTPFAPRTDPAHWRRDDPRDGPQDDDLRRLDQVRALMRKTIHERRNRPKRPPALPSEAIRALIGLETPGLDAGALTHPAAPKPVAKRAPAPEAEPAPDSATSAPPQEARAAPEPEPAALSGPPAANSALTPEVEALLKSHLRALVGDVLREELGRLRGVDAPKPAADPTKSD